MQEEIQNTSVGDEERQTTGEGRKRYFNRKTAVRETECRGRAGRETEYNWQGIKRD